MNEDEASLSVDSAVSLFVNALALLLCVFVCFALLNTLLQLFFKCLLFFGGEGEKLYV